jgi:uncharacterized membrane protein
MYVREGTNDLKRNIALHGRCRRPVQSRDRYYFDLVRCEVQSGIPVWGGVDFNVTEVLMSDLVVIVYPTEQKAEEVRQRLIKLQTEYLITMNDAVIAVKNEAGTIKLNQLVNTTAIGAASGSFWGLLIGVLFLNPILGVALGAASGALGGALSDFGINDKFMKELAASIQPGNAALFVLIKNMTADKVLKEIKDAGGVVLKTSLDESKEQILRDALAKATVAETPPQAAKSA